MTQVQTIWLLWWGNQTRAQGTSFFLMILCLLTVNHPYFVHPQFTPSSSEKQYPVPSSRSGARSSCEFPGHHRIWSVKPDNNNKHINNHHHHHHHPGYLIYFRLEAVICKHDILGCHPLASSPKLNLAGSTRLSLPAAVGAEERPSRGYVWNLQHTQSEWVWVKIQWTADKVISLVVNIPFLSQPILTHANKLGTALTSRRSPCTISWMISLSTCSALLRPSCQRASAGNDSYRSYVIHPQKSNGYNNP